MTAFWVVNNQFQNFIDSKFTLDYDSQMTDTRFVQYTGIEVQHFRDTLLQHLGNVKKSVAERTRHKRQYERRVNKRQMQTQESKIDIRAMHWMSPPGKFWLTQKALGQTQQCKMTTAGQGMIQMLMMQISNPYMTEDQYAEVQLTAGWQHGQILKETSNKAKIEKEIDVLETMNIELEHSVATLQQTTSLLANNAELKAQIQEKVFAIAALKNDLRKLKGNSVDTKFDKTSVLGKPVLQSLRNQSVVRQPNAFKFSRAQMSKQTLWVLPPKLM
ncbi:hypothetical protein Tco_1235453 [Tanacetum coccineum]